ncbi:DinB family protein [bacterium]|nr:DinB family protein [bacterium]NUP91968.1 DinB family protein [Candidatus Omnitrophota bacterium]
MSRSVIDTLASVIEASFELTLNEASRVPEENRLRQPAPGKGHPLWLIGHLAGSSDMVGGHWLLGHDPILDEPFRKKFAPDFMKGDPITGQLTDYPEWDSVVRCYEQSMSRLLEIIRALDDSQLGHPPLGPMPQRLKDLLPTLESGITRLSLHDSHHRGQIGLLAQLPR